MLPLHSNDCTAWVRPIRSHIAHIVRNRLVLWPAIRITSTLLHCNFSEFFCRTFSRLLGGNVLLLFWLSTSDTRTSIAIHFLYMQSCQPVGFVVALYAPCMIRSFEQSSVLRYGSFMPHAACCTFFYWLISQSSHEYSYFDRSEQMRRIVSSLDFIR